MTLSSFETPWARVPISIPLHVPDAVITAAVAHRRGTFGHQRGDWVAGRPFGARHHKGIDVIGWADGNGRLHSLRGAYGCAPAEGVVEFIGSDEDAKPSIVLRHSTRGSRFRISFFGDLVKVLVKDGQRLRAGQPIATVDHFFHFGVGYRRFDPREEDIFVDPFKLFPGRAALPSDMIRRARSR